MDGLQQRMNEVATWLLKQGLSVIPLGADKSPAIKWGEYIDKLLPKWEFPGCNIALLTGQFNNLVVADCDSEEAYVGWLKTKTPTPLRIRTKRGMQFYYQHPGEYIKSASHIKDSAGFEYDIKGDRSYVVAPPSLRGGHQYQVCVCSSNIRGKFILPRLLPQFNPAWRPDTEPAGPLSREAGKDTQTIRDGIKYIRNIYATSGSGGDKETYRAACKLIESGMSEADALMAMIDWNKTNASPAWGERELLYKVRRAIQQA